jgi:4-methyl-5(b-hydroxyethyl)-thiazole monophosphate biosynthesis
MKQVIVPLAPGFEEIEAITIIDVLRRAGISVTTVSLSESVDVEGAHGITVKADKLFSGSVFDGADMIVLPGGMPGSVNLNNHEGLRRKIVEFNNQGRYLGAICAAPLVFGELGLLKNREATCYPGFEHHLKEAILSTQPVVQDGKIITGRGAGKALGFSLMLVEVLAGKNVAESIGEKMIAG